jgi:hypothetical protein
MCVAPDCRPWTARDFVKSGCPSKKLVTGNLPGAAWAQWYRLKGLMRAVCGRGPCRPAIPEDQCSAGFLCPGPVRGLGASSAGCVARRPGSAPARCRNFCVGASRCRLPCSLSIRPGAGASVLHPWLCGSAVDPSRESSSGLPCRWGRGCPGWRPAAVDAATPPVSVPWMTGQALG